MLNQSLKDLNPSSEELKEIAKLLAKKRGIKGYQSMSEDELLSAFKASELLNFDKTRIEEIRKKFHDSRHKFSKSKIDKIRRNFYETENKKNLSVPKIKDIEKNFLELAKNLSKSKKYYGIKIIRNLPIDKDYKPVIIDGAFSNNYVQYESIGSENLSIKEYLDKIKPYLSDMINNHKAQREKWEIYSGDTIIECKTQRKFARQFKCLGENKEKYITFSVPIKN